MISVKSRSRSARKCASQNRDLEHSSKANICVVNSLGSYGRHSSSCACLHNEFWEAWTAFRAIINFSQKRFRTTMGSISKLLQGAQSLLRKSQIKMFKTLCALAVGSLVAFNGEALRTQDYEHKSTCHLCSACTTTTYYDCNPQLSPQRYVSQQVIYYNQLVENFKQSILSQAETSYENIGWRDRLTQKFIHGLTLSLAEQPILDHDLQLQDYGTCEYNKETELVKCHGADLCAGDSGFECSNGVTCHTECP